MVTARRVSLALLAVSAPVSFCLADAAGTPVIDTLFVDVSTDWQIGAHQPEDGHGTGAAVADFDQDGLVDLFVPQAAGVPDRLYHNLGDRFEEIAAAVGLASTASSRAALWLDYDGDGDLDLWVANDDQQALSSFALYRQEPGPVFTDVTVAAGVAKGPIVLQDNHHWAGLCAGDIDRDGYLDVFTAQWPGPAHLFRNTGEGTFVDISQSSGVAAERFAHQCAMADFDGDGWTDIYVAIDFEPNLLWLNQHDGTFVDGAAAAGLANAMNDMGMTLGDYDEDGDFDVYITNIFLPGHPEGPRHNVLLRNDTVAGALDFAEVSEAMGVDNGHFGWGTSDGLEDPSRFFENPGGGSPFADVSTAAGFDDTNWGSALVAADFDRDGDLDMVQACMETEIAPRLRLLENQRPVGAGNYLVVKPRAAGPNRFAVGALVRAHVDGRTMLRRISAGTSYMGQEPMEAFFGVGAASVVEWVTIDWPDGSRTTLTDVAANQELTVDMLFADGFESGDTSRWSQTVN
jgi:hypothetical protein